MDSEETDTRGVHNIQAAPGTKHESSAPAFCSRHPRHPPVTCGVHPTVTSHFVTPPALQCCCCCLLALPWLKSSSTDLSPCVVSAQVSLFPPQLPLAHISPQDPFGRNHTRGGRDRCWHRYLPQRPGEDQYLKGNEGRTLLQNGRLIKDVRLILHEYYLMLTSFSVL